MEKEHAPGNAFFAPIFDMEPPPIDEDDVTTNTSDENFSPFTSAVEDGWGDFTNFAGVSSDDNWARFSPPPLSNSESNIVGMSNINFESDKNVSIENMSGLENTKKIVGNGSTEYSAQLKDAVLKDASTVAKQISPEEPLFGLFYKDDTSSEIISSNNFTSFENVYFKNDTSVPLSKIECTQSDSNSNCFAVSIDGMNNTSAVEILNSNQEEDSEFVPYEEKETSQTVDAAGTNDCTSKLPNDEIARDEKFFTQIEHHETSSEQPDNVHKTKFDLPESFHNLPIESNSSVSSQNLTSKLNGLDTVDSQASEFGDFINATGNDEVKPISDICNVDHVGKFVLPTGSENSFSEINQNTDNDFQKNMSNNGNFEKVVSQQCKTVLSEDENYNKLPEHGQSEISMQELTKNNFSLGVQDSNKIPNLTNHVHDFKFGEDNFDSSEHEPIEWKESKSLSCQSIVSYGNLTTQTDENNHDLGVDLRQTIHSVDQSNFVSWSDSKTSADEINETALHTGVSSAGLSEAKKTKDLGEFDKFGTFIERTDGNHFECLPNENHLSIAPKSEDSIGKTDSIVDTDFTKDNGDNFSRSDSLSEFSGFTSTVAESFGVFQSENNTQFRAFTESGPIVTPTAENDTAVTDKSKFILSADYSYTDVSNFQSNDSPEITKFVEFKQFDTENKLEGEHSVDHINNKSDYNLSTAVLSGKTDIEVVSSDQEVKNSVNLASNQNDGFTEVFSNKDTEGFTDFSANQNADSFNDFSSNQNDGGFSDFSSNQNAESFTDFSSNQNADSFTDFSSNQNDGGFSDFSSNQNAESFTDFSSNQNLGRFSDFSSNQNDGGFSDFSSNQNAESFNDFSSNQNDGGFTDFPSNQNAEGFTDFSSNQNADGFTDFSSNQNDGGFTDFPSNQNAEGFTDFSSNQNADGFTDFSSNQNDDGFTDFPSNQNDDGFTDFSSNQNDDGFTDFPYNQNAEGFTDFSSNQNADSFTDLSSNQNDGGFTDFPSNQNAEGFTDFSSNQNADGFTDFSSNQNADGFTDFSSNQNDDSFTDFPSNQNADGFTDFSSNQNDDGFTDFPSNQNADGFTDFSSNQNDDGFTDFPSNQNADGFTDFSSNQNAGSFTDFSSNQNDDVFNDFSSNQNSDSFTSFSSSKNDTTFANFDGFNKTTASPISSVYRDQSQAKLHLHAKCSSVITSCFPSMDTDGGNRTRVYELKSHLNNNLKPDNDVSLWEELKMTDDDEDRWLTVFFMSDSFRCQLLSFNIDHQVLLKMKPSKGSGRLTPSLSPATSIGSLDTEIQIGILIPEQAITFPSRNTLLAQSQTKKNIIERVPSLSSLKKESGSEPTSETASLDLDFFANSVSNVQDSTGASVNLCDIDFSNVGNTNVEKESSESDDVTTSPEPENDSSAKQRETSAVQLDTSAIQQVMSKLNAKARTQSPPVVDLSNNFDVKYENKVGSGGVQDNQFNINFGNGLSASMINGNEQSDFPLPMIAEQNITAPITTGMALNTADTRTTTDDKYSAFYQLQTGAFDQNELTTFSEFSSADLNRSNTGSLPTSETRSDQLVYDVDMVGEINSEMTVHSSTTSVETLQADLQANDNAIMSADFAEFGNFSQIGSIGAITSNDTSFGEFESAEASDNKETSPKESLQGFPTNVGMFSFDVSQQSNVLDNTTATSIQTKNNTDTPHVQPKVSSGVTHDFTAFDNFKFADSDNNSDNVTTLNDDGLDLISGTSSQHSSQGVASSFGTVDFPDEFGAFENVNFNVGASNAFQGNKSSFEIKETKPTDIKETEPLDMFQANFASVTLTDSGGDGKSNEFMTNFTDIGGDNGNFGNFAAFETSAKNTLHTMSTMDLERDLKSNFNATSCNGLTQTVTMNAVNSSTVDQQQPSTISISKYPSCSADEFTSFEGATDDFGDFATFDSAFPGSQTDSKNSVAGPIPHVQAKPNLTNALPVFPLTSHDFGTVTSNQPEADFTNTSSVSQSSSGVIIPPVLFPTKSSVDSNDKYGALAALANTNGDWTEAFSFNHSNDGLTTTENSSLNHAEKTLGEFRNSDSAASKFEEVSNIFPASINPNWSGTIRQQTGGILPNESASISDKRQNFEESTTTAEKSSNDFADFTSFVDSSNHDTFAFAASDVNISKQAVNYDAMSSSIPESTNQISYNHPPKLVVDMAQPSIQNQVQFTDFSDFSGHTNQEGFTEFADFSGHRDETPNLSMSSSFQPLSSGQPNVLHNLPKAENFQTVIKEDMDRYDVFKTEVTSQTDVVASQSKEDQFGAFSQSFLGPTSHAGSSLGSVHHGSTMQSGSDFSGFSGFQGAGFENFPSVPPQPFGAGTHGPNIQQTFPAVFHHNEFINHSTAFDHNRLPSNQNRLPSTQNRMPSTQNHPPSQAFNQFNQYSQFSQYNLAAEHQSQNMHYQLPSNQPIRFQTGNHGNRFPTNQNPPMYGPPGRPFPGQHFPGQPHLQKGGGKSTEKPKYHPLPGGRDPFAMFNLQSNTKDLSLKFPTQTFTKHKPKLNEMVTKQTKSSGNPS